MQRFLILSNIFKYFFYIFEYVICGDTSNPKGLQAPFDEEPNESKIHFEKIGNKSDIFKFWKDNQNSDQVSNKNPIFL